MSEVAIHTYKPGIIGEIIRCHGVYYHEHWAFDVRFESQVATELGEFMRTYDVAHDSLWWASVDDEFAGAMVVDGSTPEPGQARLRWFIVPEKHQGRKIGGQLMELAVQFCRQAGFDSVHLWTFEGLLGAQKLYERAGMKIVRESTVTYWGPEVHALKYEMVL